MCYQRVPYRFYAEQMYLCRDHALLAWVIVSEQTATGFDLEPTPEPAVDHEGLPGAVYFVATGGRIKIGHTIDLERRLSQYPPDLVVLYVKAGDRAAERAEHRRFRPYLADGREWFEDRAGVRQRIEQMTEADPRWRQRWASDLDYVPRRRRGEPRVTTRPNRRMVG